ncbi:lambda exonuclease family protein [Chryseobacterium potabilaquae]|uniref:YqaJ viral recombinase domain-containing protein n=1 Tax=Chryseobacterium potabilaquae TaxID=2675057 RepID=A0A6N4X9A1_9FLAO|nr:lambda exonuclease family protein [Chryseobacterium potabilaquae]CAA7196843.1 hypothetical protein CHRY9293_02909 [Chryseobacterium potabilaquae]
MGFFDSEFIIGGVTASDYSETLHMLETKENQAKIKREEKLKQRLGRFTASNVHKLIGGKRDEKSKELSKGAVSYINEIVSEATTGETDFFETKDTRHGIAYEEEAMLYFIETTGIKVESFGEDQKFIPFGNHAGCSPDGIIKDIFIVGGAETKCPKSATFAKYATELTLENFKAECWEYYWQLQFSMFCTGATFWYFIAYDPRVKKGSKIFYLKIERNETDIENLKSKLQLAIALKEYKLKKLGYYN